MGKFFYLTRRPRKICHQPRARREPRTLHTRRWCVWSVTMLVVACLLYLAQTNRLTTNGYRIERLRQQIAQRRVENRDLERKALQLQSFQHLNQRIGDLPLVPAGQVRYAAAPPGTVSLGPGRPAGD